MATDRPCGKARLSMLTLTLMLAASITAPLTQPSAAADNKVPISADADQPIEINADSLEVQQDRSLAVFSGNVDATQGRIRLRADKLNVWYRRGGGGEADVQGAIRRIEAQGRVFVSSPEETAQGDSGVYDVPGKQIVLTGQVVLTRGENVIRGERLVMDMETGRSKVMGDGGRVRGLFVPPPKGKSE
jgi:lipopolysaccharide export system protein LptA